MIIKKNTTWVFLGANRAMSNYSGSSETRKKEELSIQVPPTSISSSETQRLAGTDLRFDRLQVPEKELMHDRKFEFGQFVAREAVIDEEYWVCHPFLSTPLFKFYMDYYAPVLSFSSLFTWLAVFFIYSTGAKKNLKKKHGESCFACFMLVKYFVPLPPNISGPSSKTKKLKKKKICPLYPLSFPLYPPPPYSSYLCS